MHIHVEGLWFKDEQGRTLLLRGVNLGGSSKVPWRPNGATWRREGFYDHRDLSFVNRPFPLEEADEHFARLEAWGLTFLRFLVTWEAIEHSGPGIYDEAYLDYVAAVIHRAARFGIRVVIDPHQDVWSRFTGGDGAPGWTLEAAGMNLTRFHATGAAITHQEVGDPFPRMIWPSNYGRFACATMWTLFFGGHDFAPCTEVEGVPIQDYLQEHYINAVRRLAIHLRGLSNVIGYETLNEPSPGYIGSPDANGYAGGLALKGPAPTIVQGMWLASGFPQSVEVKSPIPWRPLGGGTVRLNEAGVVLWREGYPSIWRQNGVWDLDLKGRPCLLRSHHFSRVHGRLVHFERDYLRAFVERYATEIQKVDPGALVFVCPVPAELASDPDRNYAPTGRQAIIHAPHWYDGLTLYLQRYVPWLGLDLHGGRVRLVVGRKRRRRSFVRQIQRHLETSQAMFGGVPTLIGETGIAFNMNAKDAYRHGDFSKQVMAMDDTLQAMDANLVSYAFWNYTADNDNLHGDQWNDEDLSIFSRDQQTGSGDIHDGGRALAAVVRPYARAIPGEPLRLAFDVKHKRFEFEFRLDPGISAPAEFYVPAYQYPDGYLVTAPHGHCERRAEEQLLVYTPDPAQMIHHLQIVGV